ncbi:MAG: hypothetical protein JSS02_04840, partial [Planctomycetes bacterium]|nr:hypothetical protein [Planctomycetota bacterium]
EPLDDDPYQGSLSLADDESLDILTNGDVVLVEGQPDESQLDRFKKPVYRVSHLEGPLKPKAE